MNKFFLNIYDYLSKNKPLSIALLLVITALCVFSALRLDYKENIADFLPTDPEKERYTSVYNDLGNQGQITVIFAADTTQLAGDEAIDAVMHFLDDAILIGMSRVRILHGTGSGILRQLIRQYLNTVPNVKKAKDEHVQFGGAGITVVDLD